MIKKNIYVFIIFYFIDVTLQILQQAEDQLLSTSSSQPGKKQMEKRAIPDFGYPNLRDVPQLLENIQRRLLG